jgi:pimeloyl-ACP methyl ester carboxylesterase
LSKFNKTTNLIEGAIILNTPITTDHTPIRYTHYRPLYLKNLAQEFINKDIDKQKWQEAYDWIKELDSITTREARRKWNTYVESAFEPVERKTTVGMAFKVLFSRPYNLIKYLNYKDNDFVSNLIWTGQKNINFFELLPKIKQPVLLVTGRFDDIAIPEEIQKAEELLKNSVTKILPNAGHQSFIDQPELFNQVILEFVLRN